MHIKQELFSTLEEICDPETILTSNTSGLSPELLASKIKNKDKFVVTHFWNPPYLLPLVEIAPCKHTSAKTLSIIETIIYSINKKPIILKNQILGFIGNRIQISILRESLYMLNNKLATAKEIDESIKKGFGILINKHGIHEILESLSETKILDITQSIKPRLCDEKSIPYILDESINNGYLGCKSYKGIYEWSPESIEVIKNKRARSLLKQLKRDLYNGGLQKKSRIDPFSLDSIFRLILISFLREINHIIKTGVVNIEEIECVICNSLGRRLNTTGPLESADMGGLDVFKSIFSYLGPDLSNEYDFSALF